MNCVCILIYVVVFGSFAALLVCLIFTIVRNRWRMNRCEYTNKKCHFAGGDDDENCLAIFEEQCPIANKTDEQLRTDFKKIRRVKNGESRNVRKLRT